MRSMQLRIVLVALGISLMGIATIYSTTFQRDQGSWQLLYQRQLLWLFLGLVLFFCMSRISYRHLWDMTYIFYGVIVALLLLVFVLGAVRLGAQRWLRIGGFNFQPSELAKLVMVLFFARYFSKKPAGMLFASTENLGFVKAFVLPACIMLFPVGLVIEQPDLGSGLLIVIVFVGILFLAGVRLKYLLRVSAVTAVCLPFAWHVLREYQKKRLLVFLNPQADPLGAGYTVIQSKISIGSGGLFGRGWLAGTQSQLHFLPEAHTDFIFAAFAEQWGFVGSCVLIALYALLIATGIQIALRTRDQFGKLLAYGISTMLALQVFVNVAMTLSMAPVVGVPLPLMSYGGSSMFVTFIALGILVNIDRKRTVF